MARTGLQRALEFDRGRDFVVTRGFKVSGKWIGPGELLDTTPFTTRRLQEMFDSRMIDVASPHAVRQRPVKVEPKVEAPQDPLDAYTDEQLAGILTESGTVPRPGASREWLLTRVRALNASEDA